MYFSVDIGRRHVFTFPDRDVAESCARFIAERRPELGTVTVTPVDKPPCALCFNNEDHERHHAPPDGDTMIGRHPYHEFFCRVADEFTECQHPQCAQHLGALRNALGEAALYDQKA